MVVDIEHYFSRLTTQCFAKTTEEEDAITIYLFPHFPRGASKRQNGDRNIIVVTWWFAVEIALKT